MPLPDANKKSPRVYPLLQNTDLENIAFATLQSTGTPIAIEEMNEDELRRLVLVNLARLSVKGEWDGLLSTGGGGGNDYNLVVLEDVINTGYIRYPISNQPPYGSTGVTAETYGSSTSYDEPYAFPFIAPESGEVGELGIEITSAAASTCNLEVGIYSTTATTGAPNALLGKAVFDITTTGYKYDTSLSSTVTLVKGTQYWILFVRDTSAISYGIRAVQGAFGTPTMCPTDTPNPNGGCKQIRLDNSDNTLPTSSITLTDFYPQSANPPCISLKIT